MYIDNTNDEIIWHYLKWETEWNLDPTSVVQKYCLMNFVEFLDFLTFLSTIPTFVILFIPNVVLLWWAFVLEIMGYEKGWRPQYAMFLHYLGYTAVA